MLRNLLILPFAILAACSNSSSDSLVKSFVQVRNAKPGLGKAVVIGDSLAAGSGSTDWNNVPAGCLYNAFKQPTIDHSKPGRTSMEVLMSVQSSLDERPKVIFISSGGNDAILDKATPGSYGAAKTMDEMRQLFERALNSGALVVYLGLNPPFQGAERLPDVATMALRMGVLVVEGMNGFWGNTDLMSDDIHPNDKGYEIMCERTLKALKGFYP